MSSTDAKLDCGVMFFSASAESLAQNKYQVVIDTARYADRRGFSSIWVPERHFTSLGGLYPNPSVLQSALAMVTERIQLRAGSVVLPLHNPLRVAEEWAMVDNLSQGRVGLSFASGWHPADFTFFPERYQDRQSSLFEAIPIVQRLWSGESLTVMSGSGEAAQVTIFPRPLQKQLPTWVTAAGNPETFARVGELGANLLTHLLDQGVEGLAQRIELYRQARASHGHDPRAGRVSIMVHTFMGPDIERAREQARRPFCEFLKLNAGLLKGLAKARGRDMDVSQLSAEDREAFVQFIYDRFVDSRAFIGSPQSCLPLAARLYDAGVDELLFLLDFGPSYDQIIDGLPYLDELRQLCSSEAFARQCTRMEGTLDVAPPAHAVPPASDDSLEKVRQRSRHRLSGADLYARLGQRGIVVDRTLQGITELCWADGEALASVAIAESVNGQERGRVLLLEAALQAGQHAAVDPQAETFSAYVASSVTHVELGVGIRGDYYCHAKRRAEAAIGAAKVEVEVRILNEASALVGALRVGFQKVHASTGVQDSLERGLGQCMHAVEWRIAQWQPAGLEPGGWLIIADREGVGAALARLLEGRGATCLQLGPEDLGPSREGAPFAYDANGLRRRLEALARDPARPLKGVIHLSGLDAAPADETTPEGLEADSGRSLGTALTAMRALALLEGVSRKPKLWLVTRGAQPVRAAAAPLPAVAFAQAPLWGLGQTFSVEHRQLWGALVDLDPASTSAESAQDILNAIEAETSEDLIGFRARTPYVPRLVPKGQPLEATIRFRENASYLITGGLGGIGGVVADWLVARGAKHLLLVGRHVPPERGAWKHLPEGDRWQGTIAAIRALEGRGAQVSYVALDVGDADAWSKLLADRAGQPPIRGVFHAAGILRPKALVDLDADEIKAAFRAKVAGTWHLHRVFQQQGLDSFVTFSSAPPQLGALGQNLAAYNAANAFMDALVHHRRSCGLPGLTINWGPWAQVGLHTLETSAKSNLDRLAAFGLKGMSNREALGALGHLLSGAEVQRWVLAANWQQLCENDFLIATKPFFAEVASLSQRLPSSGPQLKRAELLERLAALTPKARRQQLVAHVRGLVTGVMGLKSPTVDWRRGLFDMGMDSLMALELKTKLQNDVGISIPATLAFDFPTVDAIAGHLEQELFARRETRAGTPALQLSGDTSASFTEEQLDALGEAELEAALLRKLEEV